MKTAKLKKSAAYASAVHKPPSEDGLGRGNPMLELNVSLNNLNNGVTSMNESTKIIMANISDFASTQDPMLPIDKRQIQNNYQISPEEMDLAINEMERAQYIEFKFVGDKDNFLITQAGHNALLGIGEAQKSNSVTIHGDVNHSALAVDGSKSTVNIGGSVFVENLIREIQADQGLSEPEKLKWSQRLSQMSKDPRLLTILGSVLGSL